MLLMESSIDKVWPGGGEEISEFEEMTTGISKTEMQRGKKK